MIQPEKRLVFHFYINENWEESIMNKIHLECLRHYSYVFDEVIFAISLDDTSNYELIKSLEYKLLELNLTPRISFKIVENTYLRDSKTFFDYIVDELNRYNGLTFFAHNKGTTNLNKYNLDNIMKWITSMYFLSLEYIDEVVHTLTEGRELTYGSLLNEIKYDEIEVTDEGIEPKQQFIDRTRVFLGEKKYLYMGTFFWLNGMTIYEYLRKNKIEIPKLADRWYAENFCSNLFPLDFAFSHRGRYSKNYLDDGGDLEGIICNCFYEEEYYDYVNFHNNIMNSIK